MSDRTRELAADLTEKLARDQTTENALDTMRAAGELAIQNWAEAEALSSKYKAVLSCTRSVLTKQFRLCKMCHGRGKYYQAPYSLFTDGADVVCVYCEDVRAAIAEIDALGIK